MKDDQVQKKAKRRIKVTTETIRMRYQIAKKDIEFFEKNGKPFNFSDGAKLFNVSTQCFWYFHSDNPKYSIIPSKQKCPNCGVSMYEKFSDWINDGTLNSLIGKGVKI